MKEATVFYILRTYRHKAIRKSARRKFSESIKNDKERAENALEQIQLLYEVEHQIKD